MYLPTPVRHDVLEGEPVRLSSLAGQRIAILNNGWDCMDELTQLLEERLMEEGVSEILHVRTPHAQPLPKDHIGEIAAKVAGAITGLGN
jgi:hypothetical protein